MGDCRKGEPGAPGVVEWGDRGSGRWKILRLRPQLPSSSSTDLSDFTYKHKLKTKLLKISRWWLKNIKPQAQGSGELRGPCQGAKKLGGGSLLDWKSGRWNRELAAFFFSTAIMKMVRTGQTLRSTVVSLSNLVEPINIISHDNVVPVLASPGGIKKCTLHLPVPMNTHSPQHT